MAIRLRIIKLSERVWKHWDSVGGFFVLTKFYAKYEFNAFNILEVYGSERFTYNVDEIEVYDIGGGAETFTNFDDLFLRLEQLSYAGFYQDGNYVFTPASWVSLNADNSLTLGLDGKFYVPESSGGIQSVVAGTNVTVDNTDPLNPIVSASGGGSSAERIVFNNRSTWTFPNVASAPFPLISSTNFELSVANLNSGTDVALTALNSISPIFVPIGIAPFDMLLKKVIIEGRQVFGSWQGFDLRCVIGSNRTESVGTALYSHLDSQVVDEFNYVPPSGGNAFINHASVSSVVIPANHGVILMLSFSRTGISIAPVLSVQLEFEKVI